MRTNTMLSDLELTLLGRLLEDPRSGYELRKLLSASPGAVYPALRRLARNGMIEGESDTRSARQKETYHLTPSGRRALRAALVTPSIDDVRRDPDAVAARLSFLSGPHMPAFLQEFARLCQECGREWEGREGVAAEYQAAIYDARARWAVKVSRRRS